MPLAANIEQQSYARLAARLGMQDWTNRQKGLLKRVHELAAQDSIVLDMEHNPSLIGLIVADIKSTHVLTDEDQDQAVCSIYFKVLKRWKQQSRADRAAAAGAMVGAPWRPVHIAGAGAELTDSDMLALMPKSTSTVEVLAPLRQGDSSDTAIIEGIMQALSNGAVRKVMFASGPGHWRGIYLEKPANRGDAYQLKIFDSFWELGPVRVRSRSVLANQTGVTKYIVDLLERSGIKKKDIEISLIGPPTKQTGSSACGDYVCAQSYLEMGQEQHPLVAAMGQGSRALRQITMGMSRGTIIESPLDVYESSLPVDLRQAQSIDAERIGAKEFNKQLISSFYESAQPGGPSFFRQISERSTEVSEKIGTDRVAEILNNPTKDTGLADEELANLLQYHELQSLLLRK